MPQSGITIKKLRATHLEAAMQNIVAAKQHAQSLLILAQLYNGGC